MASEVKSTGIDSAFRSDHQRIGERDLADRASDKADRMADKAKEAGDTFMDKAGDVKHSVQATGHNIAERTKHTHQAICDFTKENPTSAVLLAFGLGAILARVLPGR